MHGAIRYAADRWIGGDMSYSAGSPGIVITNGSTLEAIHQGIAHFPNLIGTNCTLSVNVNGQLYCASGVVSANDITHALFVGDIASIWIQNGRCYFSMLENVTAEIYNMSLISGNFTTKTLPPWVAPDPAVELIKCQNYFRPFPEVMMATIDSPTSVNAQAAINPPMRSGVNPTVTMVSSATANTTSGAKSVTISYQGATSPDAVSYVFYSAEALTQGTPAVITGISGWISSDL